MRVSGFLNVGSYGLSRRQFADAAQVDAGETISEPRKSEETASANKSPIVALPIKFRKASVSFTLYPFAGLPIGVLTGESNANQAAQQKIQDALIRAAKTGVVSSFSAQAVKQPSKRSSLSTLARIISTTNGYFKKGVLNDPSIASVRERAIGLLARHYAFAYQITVEQAIESVCLYLDAVVIPIEGPFVNKARDLLEPYLYVKSRRSSAVSDSAVNPPAADHNII